MMPAPSSAGYRHHRYDGWTAVLLAVRLDQALDELVDGAGLGEVALLELVAQLGLGLALVPLAGLVVSAPGLLALDLAGLAGQVFPGLLRLVSLLVHEAADGLSLLADGTG